MSNIGTGNPLNESFVKALSYYRDKSGKTNREIAKHLGISAPTISNWSAGKHLPDMDTLQRLADYLKAPIDQFFNFTALQQNEREAIKELVPVLQELSDEDIKLLSIVALRLNK